MLQWATPGACWEQTKALVQNAIAFREVKQRVVKMVKALCQTKGRGAGKSRNNNSGRQPQTWGCGGRVGWLAPENHSFGSPRETYFAKSPRMQALISFR